MSREKRSPNQIGHETKRTRISSEEIQRGDLASHCALDTLTIGALIGGLSLSLLLGCEASTAPPIPEAELDQMVLVIDQEVEMADISVAEIDQEVVPDQEIDEGPPIDMMLAVEPPLMPAVVVVKLGSEQTTAGLSNQISCLVYAQNGQVINVDPAWGEPRFDVRPLAGWSWSEGDSNQVVGERAGDYDARCYFPSLGLRSDPKPWRVTPGEAQRVITSVESPIFTAGDEVEATCAVFDAYDNPIEDVDINWSIVPPLVELTPDQDPMSAGAQITRAGEYQLNCTSPEAMGADLSPATIRVTPDLPAQLAVSLGRAGSVFNIGDFINISPEVTDQYENVISDASMSTLLSPELPRFGDLRFYAERAGSYVLEVSVDGETLNDVELSRRILFTVEDGAPRITCETPELGDQLRMNTVTVSGRVLDLSEITRFTVNGSPVALDSRGRFSAEVTPSWGLNVVNLIAIDEFGEESLERCMFFAANSYLSEGLSISDVALLHLSQDAIDDGSPRSPISSLGDLLGEMLNSTALINTIDATLDAQNPIVPTACRFDTWLGCAFSAGAEYQSLSVGGPNSVSLDLVSNGVEVDATIRDVVVGLTTRGTITQSGTVQLSSARVRAELAISLSNGIPQVSVRGTPTVTLGNIDLQLNISFSIAQSIINGFLNLVLGAFEGLIRDELSSALEDYITSEVDAILSSALNSLDLSALGLNLNLPRPFGGGFYRLNLSFSLNRLNVSSSRMRIGLRSIVSGNRGQTLSIEGIPAPSGSRVVELNPGFNRDAAGAAHVTLLNSVLTQLWRGGFFNVVELPETDAGDVDLTLQLLVPPALELSNNGTQVTLHFGPATADLTIPALFDAPLTLNVGGQASASVSLGSGDTLSFNQLTVDQVFLSSPGFTMSAAASEAVEEVLMDVIQSLLDEALNEALPSFPIPDFALPNSLSAYGIPRNTRLGVRSLTLSQDGARLIVKGDLR